MKSIHQTYKEGVEELKDHHICEEQPTSCSCFSFHDERAKALLRKFRTHTLNMIDTQIEWHNEMQDTRISLDDKEWNDKNVGYNRGHQDTITHLKRERELIASQ